MSKVKRSLTGRDERSLEAAKAGNAVSARLIVLRYLDPRSKPPVSRRRVWIVGASFSLAVIALPNADAIVELVRTALS